MSNGTDRTHDPTRGNVVRLFPDRTSPHNDRGEAEPPSHQTVEPNSYTLMDASGTRLPTDPRRSWQPNMVITASPPPHTVHSDVLPFDEPAPKPAPQPAPPPRYDYDNGMEYPAFRDVATLWNQRRGAAYDADGFSQARRKRDDVHYEAAMARALEAFPQFENDIADLAIDLANHQVSNEAAARLLTALGSLGAALPVYEPRVQLTTIMLTGEIIKHLRDANLSNAVVTTGRGVEIPAANFLADTAHHLKRSALHLIAHTDDDEAAAAAAVALNDALPALASVERDRTRHHLAVALVGIMSTNSAPARLGAVSTFGEIMPALPRSFFTSGDATRALGMLDHIASTSGDSPITSLASNAYSRLHSTINPAGAIDAYLQLADLGFKFDHEAMSFQDVTISNRDFEVMRSAIHHGDALARTLAATVLGFIGAIRLHPGDTERILQTGELLNDVMDTLPVNDIGYIGASVDELRTLSVLPPYTADGPRTIELTVETLYETLGSMQADTNDDVSREFQGLARKLAPFAISSYANFLERLARDYPAMSEEPRVHELFNRGMNNLAQAARSGFNPAVRRLATSRLSSLRSFRP